MYIKIIFFLKFFRQDINDTIRKYDEVDIFFKAGRFGNYLSYKGKNFALSNKDNKKKEERFNFHITLLLS